MFSGVKRIFEDRSGNFAILFALSSFALLLGIGVAIDFARAYGVRVGLQANLDAALVAAVKMVDKTDETSIKNAMVKWLNAQKVADDSTYDIKADDIQLDVGNGAVTAVARATLPTTFLALANISTMKVATKASVIAPSASYINVYVVLDKSASMLLAATTAGQTTMRANTKRKSSDTGCVFGCHVVEGDPWQYKGKTYTTNYSLARALGVTLRADVSVTAAKEVLDMIDTYDPGHSRIKVSFYTAGSKLTQVVAPTFNTTTARNALDDDAKKLNSATSEDKTRFDATLPALTQSVGAAGDGKTAATPLKLVLLLTDGTLSQRDWVLNGVDWDSQGRMYGGTDWFRVAPLNPAWCSELKTNKATLGVLYTEYLPVPWDQGYVHTIGETMSSANWKATWSGTMQPGVPTFTSRRDYLPYALADCASPKMFLSAASQKEIEGGLSSLFGSYLGSVRLTQ
ncbi:TadE/TadG family type IV pilus assembly protein [Rhizobium sp.]